MVALVMLELLPPPPPPTPPPTPPPWKLSGCLLEGG